ncbi:MAG: chalcone isomerase family protein [Deltaproteobacteria bacterium]|nr:chalcone isomerase family protein [Deltaproteobacteria bacterium]
MQGIAAGFHPGKPNPVPGSGILSIFRSVARWNPLAQTFLVRRLILPAIVLLLLASGTSPVTAADRSSGEVRVLEGVSFPERFEGPGVSLRLHNLALLRYKVIFRAYVAALYLSEGADPGTVLADIPKRLEISYFWAITAADIGKAGEEILARNVAAATFSALRSRLDRIRSAYRDVTPGDRYALTYRPGAGTELALNGKPLVVIEGEDFAAAYFSIWLGEKPLDRGLKDELLRKGKGTS